MFKFLIFEYIAISLLFSNSAQFCVPYDQPCSLDYTCCGGCCLNGICKDAYLDCQNRSTEDMCLQRHCEEGQVCVTYQPSGCKGCGPLAECRLAPLSDKLNKNKTLTHYHLFNSSGSSMLNLRMLSLCIILSVFIPQLI